MLCKSEALLFDHWRESPSLWCLQVTEIRTSGKYHALIAGITVFGGKDTNDSSLSNKFANRLRNIETQGVTYAPKSGISLSMRAPLAIRLLRWRMTIYTSQASDNIHQ